MAGVVGPLTTVFTQPASCSAITAYSVQNTLYLYQNMGFPGSATLKCYPDGFNAFIGYDAFPTMGSQWYSPGVCPESWNLAESKTASQMASYWGPTTAKPGEQIGFCCPAQFTLNTDVNQPPICRSNLYSSVTIVGSIPLTTDTVVPCTSSCLVSADYVYESFVEIRWLASTPPQTAVSSTTTGMPSTETTSAITGAANSPANSNSDSIAQEGNRIQLGVGIGIGLPAAIATIVGLWWACVRER